jgi:hypothetical protein
MECPCDAADVPAQKVDRTIAKIPARTVSGSSSHAATTVPKSGGKSAPGKLLGRLGTTVGTSAFSSCSKSASCLPLAQLGVPSTEPRVSGSSPLGCTSLCPPGRCKVMQTGPAGCNLSWPRWDLRRSLGRRFSLRPRPLRCKMNCGFGWTSRLFATVGGSFGLPRNPARGKATGARLDP